MRHQDIQVGDRLKLKPTQPYGDSVSLVQVVTQIVTRGDYKVPWIYTSEGAFKPSDFARKENAR